MGHRKGFSLFDFDNRERCSLPSYFLGNGVFKKLHAGRWRSSFFTGRSRYRGENDFRPPTFGNPTLNPHRGSAPAWGPELRIVASND